MNRTSILASLLAVAFVGAGLLTTAAPVADPAAKLDERLRARLADAAPGEPVPVIVLTHGSPLAAADAARALGRVVWTYDVIDGFAGSFAPVAIEALAARSDVRGVWLDRPVTTVMDISHRAVEADKAWAVGYTGAGVTVAVIDTGIEVLHPFFAGAIVSCVSTIGGLVSPECTDSDGHGTHVAGTVASRDPDYPGVSKGASIAAVRVLHAAGAGTSSDIIAGINWVKNNRNLVSPPIRVATMSIGFIDPGCGDGTGPEAEAANALVASGVPFTVAAGNSGHSGCTIDGASAAAQVTTIAAVDDRNTVTQQDDVIADFSSGGSSRNNKPDVSFPGVGITSAFIGAGVLIATMDGTSMATPHAAGTYALLFHKEPGLSASAAKDRLLGTAVKTDATGATFNFVYGHGLGNACRSLQLAGCATVEPPPPPRDVHVDAITLSSTHGKGKNAPHVVTSDVKIVDASGAAVAGASVSIRVTSPEGNQYTASGSTGSNGVATLSVNQRGGGHGTWQSCVTAVAGTNMNYVASANRETCDTIAVS